MKSHIAYQCFLYLIQIFDPDCTSNYICKTLVQFYLLEASITRNQVSWISASTFKIKHNFGHWSKIIFHAVILSDWTLKKWGLSNFTFQSFQGFIDPKTKIIFQLLWRILDGCTNRAQPSWPILKNCQNDTFWFLHEIWNFYEAPSF